MPGLPKKLSNWLGGLRFPVLALLAGVLFFVNVLVPDALPFVDELLLALLTILLSRLKRKRPSDTSDGKAG